ncbi:oxidoreductase [Stutzerimonas urumqiensis]|uniref:PDR/VanB family oxidoreductase n=1 Tax=Stutzerimonas urumqiensis TaxID=638269 RepID=UPI003BAA95F0
MIEVMVAARREQAEGILGLELTSVDGDPLPAFSAGSHIDLHLPGGLVRQYSLCNHPEERHRYEIAVLKEADGRGGSQAVHQLTEGVRLQISEPRNLFPLMHEARRSLLFAGGIGITPILCMAQRLAHTGADFELHYCARSATRAAFVDRLRQSPFAERVHFHFDDEGARLELASMLASADSGTHLYVCGPGGFMEHVLGSARAAGWAEENLHREYFAAAPVAEQVDRPFVVQLASTGQVIEVPADRTVAQMLEVAGVFVPLSCEQGICGTCLTRVLEGEPEHRDLFLTDEERAANDQFTPCCSRARSTRLVLDL